MPPKILMQAQSLQPPKGNSLCKTTHRSLRSVHSTFVQLILLLNPQNPILYNAFQAARHPQKCPFPDRSLISWFVQVLLTSSHPAEQFSLTVLSPKPVLSVVAYQLLVFNMMQMKYSMHRAQPQCSHGFIVVVVCRTNVCNHHRLCISSQRIYTQATAEFNSENSKYNKVSQQCTARLIDWLSRV